MFAFLLICSLLIPLSMLVLGYRWQNHPPKNRYGVSGYRTTMSRLNDETWRYAHKYWGRMNFILGFILSVLSVVILLLVKDHPHFETISLDLVFFQLAVMVLTIIPTEIALHRHFTNEGRRK
ncbi:MAG: SdpI family protein [Aerococcus sp.]|nr:SdpI family protein [Aerococcus sp.]